MTNNNYASVARYNAHTEVAARASTRPFGAIPGLASLNACGDLRVCNYQNVTAEHFLARQLRPLEDGVMAELINANWPALDTSGTGEGTIYAPGISDERRRLTSVEWPATAGPLHRGRADFYKLRVVRAATPSPSASYARADACSVARADAGALTGANAGALREADASADAAAFAGAHPRAERSSHA